MLCSAFLDLEELSLGMMTHFFHQLIPPLEDRTRVTWWNFPYTIAFLVPMLFMAYLARRPGTRLIRVLMLPCAIAVTLRSTYGYVWAGRGLFRVYNWGEALVGLMFIGKAIDYAFASDGHYKVGEKQPGMDQRPAIGKKDYDPKDTSHSIPNGAASPSSIPTTGTRRPGSSFLPVALQDAAELLFIARGIGWNWGKGVYIPPERKPLSRGPFLLATFHSYLRNFLILDFLESCLKLVPGVGHPSGGTIFLPYLPPLQRYALSTAIHFVSGFSLLAGVQMWYDFSTLVGVGLIGHDPASWPPVLDRPWAATSLHEFWAKRWHQLVRRTFLVFGGRPARRLLGRGALGYVGMVLGTFAASGLYHELSSSSMGAGSDWRVLAFFISQGFLVLMETVWRAVTGKRVGGCLGRVWVYIDIGVLGQPLMDAWHRRGLAGGMIVPPIISPTRRVLFPLVSKLTGLDLSLYPL